MDILRFITAGSVDDGKSTLIGRLLYDSEAISSDILFAIESATKNKEDANVDLSLLTDGLRAEREQGITIDVAYKYFSTNKRKFIIADAPGHVQYTRNMVTAASTAQLAIILVDAQHGIVEQTKRHTLIASLLGIKHIVLAINKMDLKNYAEVVFNSILKDYLELTATLVFVDIQAIPLSAKKGDNVVSKSNEMTWYKGPALLPYLENVTVVENTKEEPARFQVQYVIRPNSDKWHEYRGFAGKILSGEYAKGQKVNILPSGISTSISKIEFAGNEKILAKAGEAVTLHLEHDVEVSRGTYIVPENSLSGELKNDFEVTICWMNEKELIAGQKYLLQHNAKRVKAVVKEIRYELDVNSFEQKAVEAGVGLNTIARINLKTSEPLFVDTYNKNKANGSGILIDEFSHNTVAAVLFE